MTEDFDIRDERTMPSEREFENALRPPKFQDFSGQSKVVENLEVFVEANHSTTPSYTVLRDWVRPR